MFCHEVRFGGENMQGFSTLAALFLGRKTDDELRFGRSAFLRSKGREAVKT
jgi:hypothetical protein